jgi:hypothetical protein
MSWRDCAVAELEAMYPLKLAEVGHLLLPSAHNGFYPKPQPLNLMGEFVSFNVDTLVYFAYMYVLRCRSINANADFHDLF